jgi:hypothetical protein
VLEWGPFLLFQLVLVLSCLTVGWILGMMTILKGPWTQDALHKMLNGGFVLLLVLLIVGIFF